MRATPAFRRCPWALVAGAALGLLLMLAGSLPAASADPFAAMIVQRPARGGPAPAFRLKTAEGTGLALADLRGKVVAFYFWRTW